MSVDAAVRPTRPAEHTSGPGESGPGTPPGTEGVVPLVRRFGPSILINGVAPYIIYFVLHHQFQVAELPALLGTSIPPLLDAPVASIEPEVERAYSARARNGVYDYASGDVVPVIPGYPAWRG